jgi:hypothetical protein
MCFHPFNNSISTARNAFFKKVSSILKEYGTGIPILGGDFNETMNQIDRKSASRKNTKPLNFT